MLQLDRLSSWPVAPWASALQDPVLRRAHGQQAAPAPGAGHGAASAKLTARVREFRTVKLDSESHSAWPMHLIYLQIDCLAYSVKYTSEQCIEVKGLLEMQHFRMEWLGLKGNIKDQLVPSGLESEGTPKAFSPFSMNGENTSQFSMDWTSICYKRHFFKWASSSYKGLKITENVFLWKTIWKILL